MKLRSALVAIVLALIAFPAMQAQGPGGAGERRMQMMFKDITLSAPQRATVDSIMAHYRTRMGPMTPGARPDSASMANRRSLLQKQNADIRAALTAQQQPLFDRNIEEMRNSMQRPQGQ